MNLLMTKKDDFVKKWMSFQMDPKRVAMSFSGVTLCSVGVGFCLFADFGVAPFQTFSMGLNQVAGFGLSYGTYCMLLNIPMLLVPLILDRKMINISTFVGMFLGGYVIDWTAALLDLLLAHPAFWLRILFLIAGLLIMCYACALYYVADLGVSTYDAIPLIITERTGMSFRVVRTICDLLCVAIGFFCGIYVGIGTLAAAFFTGPLITFFKNQICQHQQLAVSSKIS